jgi:catechol 2,3-dioxygenase-like lactoylglutathione lyase family enzyme
MEVRNTGLRLGFTLLCVFALACSHAAEESPAASPGRDGSPHTIGLAKFIVGDLAATKGFYETLFDMKEVGHYSADGVYDEPIMGFAGGGARLALFKPLAEPPVKKPQAPQVLIYTPDFETLVKRIEDARQPILRLPSSESGPFKIAIARDPSGNAVEIMARAGRPLEIGGSKLIVDDREKAEQFFTTVFGVKPIQRFRTPAYDEVLLGFGDGPWLALFEPKNEAPLPKSQFPLVAIYTTEFDTVLERIKSLDYGYRELNTSTPNLRIAIAKDPAGNAIEIIRRQ